MVRVPCWEAANKSFRAVVERVIFSAMPPELTLAAWMVVTADILLSLRLLRRSGDTELLSWRAMSERFG